MCEWLFTGLVGPLLAAAIIQRGVDRILQKRERVKRRRQILLLVSRCAEIVWDNAINGETAKKWSRPSGTDSLARDHEYWELASQALGLFEIDEQIVAEWLEFELAAGREGFFHYLQDQRVPRRKKAAQLGLNAFIWDGPDESESREYGPPRASMLAEWAELRSEGPIYDTGDSCGDRSRRHILESNSEILLVMRRSPVHHYAPHLRKQRGLSTEERQQAYRDKLRAASSKDWRRRNGSNPSE